LRRVMPELHFVNAAAIYLQTRVAGKNISAQRLRRNLEAFDKRMRQFQRHADKRGGDVTALGLLNAMSGFLHLSNPTAGEGIRAGSRAFAESARLMPTNANAQTVAAVSMFSEKSWAIPLNDRGAANQRLLASPDSEQLQKSLLRAMDLDPKNVYAKVNLEKLFVLQDADPNKKPETAPMTNFRKRLQGNQQVSDKVLKKP